jgi:hypothetical protein
MACPTNTITNRLFSERFLAFHFFLSNVYLEYIKTYTNFSAIFFICRFLMESFSLSTIATVTMQQWNYQLYIVLTVTIAVHLLSLAISPRRTAKQIICYSVIILRDPQRLRGGGRWTEKENSCCIGWTIHITVAHNNE